MIREYLSSQPVQALDQFLVFVNSHTSQDQQYWNDKGENGAKVIISFNKILRLVNEQDDVDDGHKQRSQYDTQLQLSVLVEKNINHDRADAGNSQY